MKPPPWTVLVTGATTGVGLALARRLLKSPHRLVLTARESSMARFAQEGIFESDKVRLRPLDVTNNEQRRNVVRDTQAEWGVIDVLVNNAGLAVRSVVEHMTASELAAQMDVNLIGPISLARHVLPAQRAQGFGRILNVSSVGGMMAMPTMGAYSASKWALEGASESLWYEVRPWGVAVSLIEPGFIRSDGFEHVRYTAQSSESNDHLEDAYHNHYENMSGFIEKVMRRSPATPESVARCIDRTLHRRKPPLRVLATPDANLFSLMRRMLPRRPYHWILYRSLPGIRRWGPGSLSREGS